MKSIVGRWALATLAATAAFSGWACSGFYIGKDASLDGNLVIGRTQDTPPWNLCFRVDKVPGGEYGPYAYVASLGMTSWGKGSTIKTARDGGVDDGKRHFCAVCANEKGVACAGRVSASRMIRHEICKFDPPNAYCFGGHNFDTLIAANCATAREALVLSDLHPISAGPFL